MTVQKVELINGIAKELQSRYTFDDIDILLSSYQVKHPSGSPSYHSKRIYAKEALAQVDNEIISNIANDLGVESSTPAAKMVVSPPKIWQNIDGFKLFISHLAKHKDKAVKLKQALGGYNILSFVAHEDINPTLLWKSEIEKALHAMDAMLCIHTEGFSKSVWTQQEIGFAMAKNVKIISLRMDEDPQGFISKHQAVLRRGRNASQLAKEMDSILCNDPMTKDKLLRAQMISF